VTSGAKGEQNVMTVLAYKTVEISTQTYEDDCLMRHVFMYSVYFWNYSSKSEFLMSKHGLPKGYNAQGAKITIIVDVAKRKLGAFVDD